MNRLWRVLYQPRQVFDEIREWTPISLPLWAILIVGFVCYVITLTDHKGYYWFFEFVLSIVFSLWSLIWTMILLLAWATYYWIASTILKAGKQSLP